jgi:hypothetical protein
MDAQTICRRQLIVLSALFVGASVAAGQDTTFLDPEDLGRELLVNVVRIRGMEHGFGLVVGTTNRHVFVATARHVIGESNDGRIEVVFCQDGRGAATAQAAEPIVEFSGGASDVALLRVPRPQGYQPRLRALAEEAKIESGQQTWLLGQSQQCGLAPRSGAVARLRDARDNLRIEFPGALGGSSGGPVVSGYGVLGLIIDASDLTFTAYSAAALAAKVAAQVPGIWQLEPARNIPPTDPRAAQVDLAETLNLYIFSVRNLAGLLLQPTVPQTLYFNFSRDYNTAINRFRDARDRYDGALQRDWPPDVLPMWVALRERLWAVHQVFLAFNDGDSKAIFEQKKAPPAVQARMRALEPDLLALQSGSAEFLKALGQRSKP